MNNKDIQSLNKRLRLVVTNAYLTKATSTNVLDVDDKANTISTSYTYDINTGNKLSATDGNGNIMTYTYDKLRKLLKVVEPSKDTTLASMTYDTNEKLLTQTDANNNTKNFIYDNQNRIRQNRQHDTSTNRSNQHDRP